MSDTPHGAHGHDEHGHGGSRFIQHHYDDAQHQFDSGKLGIWLFLAQEVLFFSALFVAYVLYRHHHPELYSYAHKYLDVKYGAINTAVLIFSSLTAAWGVRCAQLNQQKRLILCIVATLLCALTFLGIKYIEYSHKVHEHILFGRYFDPCVSSGNVPLLTKNNHCPGHKSSVVWNTETARPLFGCVSNLAVDQDPIARGAQVDCKVFELKVEPAKGGDGKQKVDEKTKLPQFTTKESHEITNKCPNPFDAALRHARGQPQVPHSYPCWREAAQPHVCRVGYYYTERCKAGACASSGETFEVVGPFGALRDCDDAKKKKGIELAATNETETKEGAPLTVADYGDCVRSNAVGFIVEYGDHEERGDEYQIKADCKLPPKPVVSEELFPDKQQTLGVGDRSAVPEQRFTTHELHELEAAGPPPDHTNMFFTIYFAMTGLHGIHVLAGVIVFVWLLIRALKGHFTPDYFGPIDFAALYWHIVDLIWIFLFPLLYLIH